MAKNHTAIPAAARTKMTTTTKTTILVPDKELDDFDEAESGNGETGFGGGTAFGGGTGFMIVGLFGGGDKTGGGGVNGGGGGASKMS